MIEFLPKNEQKPTSFYDGSIAYSHLLRKRNLMIAYISKGK